MKKWIKALFSRKGEANRAPITENNPVTRDKTSIPGPDLEADETQAKIADIHPVEEAEHPAEETDRDQPLQPEQANEPEPEPEPEPSSPVPDSEEGDDALPTPTLKEAFAAKYPRHVFILDMFEAANLCEAKWEHLTKSRLQSLIDYMAERIAPNSVHQYATLLKAVLNLYSDEVRLPRGFAKTLTPKKCACTSVFLNEDELERLENYTPADKRELYVRDTFLLGAYCGCRHSDAVRLSTSNIVDGNLQYVSVKTKIPTTLPLKPVVARLLENAPGDDFPEVSHQTYNNVIRRICRTCQITRRVKVFKAGREMEGEKWRFVASHTARRSFATNLYLRGVDIFTISKLLGHASVESTQQYIQSGARTDSEELMGYFQ